jgi:uncharacterized protein (UPF0333 family)
MNTFTSFIYSSYQISSYFETLFLSLIAITLCSIVTPIWAANYTVSNSNDSGAGSLRQAIINANANCDLDHINFAITGPAIMEVDNRGTVNTSDDIQYA